MVKENKFKIVDEYLRNYSHDNGTFDFNGLLHLILTGLDNLKKHHIEVDLEEYSCSITDEQAIFLEKLLSFRKKFPEKS